MYVQVIGNFFLRWKLEVKQGDLENGEERMSEFPQGFSVLSIILFG